MTTYVLGVATDNEGVIVIQKEHPEWQKGLINFVGGKVEPGEFPVDAMVREFKEETNIDSTPDNWIYIGEMYRKNDFVCHIFKMHSKEVLFPITITDENVFKISYIDMQKPMNYFMPNLNTIFAWSQSSDQENFNALLKLEYPEIYEPTA